jgi:SAM-dependent methyltransferase
VGLSKILYSMLQRYVGTERMVHRAAHARRVVLTDELTRLFGNKVQSGPFAEMVLPDADSWGDGDRAAKLLGTYEENLHASLYRAVERAPATVVNVGCAEGFYAVGLARLLPQGRVFAFDIDSHAGSVCRAAAAANGVGDRVTVEGLCTPEALSSLAQRPGGVLLFLDCEGAEKVLLDPLLVAGLEHCDILVETHDVVERGLTELVEQRLSPSHRVERLSQGGRNPNDIPELAAWSELDRWLLVDERRLESMFWLACWAKSRE